MRVKGLILVFGAMLLLPSASVLLLADDDFSGDGIHMDHSSPIAGDAAFTIDGDLELEQKATEMGWEGAGTSSDPIIADGMEIDAQGGSQCVRITNTNLHLNITDSVFMNATSWSGGYGIYLNSCGNVSVINCTIKDNRQGIMIMGSTNISCKNCTFFNNSQSNIYSNYSENVSFLLCNSSDSYYGAVITSSEKIAFSHCVMNRSSFTLDIRMTNNSVLDGCDFGSPGTYSMSAVDNLTIRNCNFVDAPISLNSCRFSNIIGNTLRDSNLNIGEPITSRIWENDFFNQSIFFTGGLGYFNEIEISSNNTVNGLPIFYAHDTDYMGGSLATGYGQYILGNVSNVIISNLNLGRAGYPMIISYSNNIWIDNVYLSNSINGITVFECRDLEIADSTVVDSLNYGLSIQRTSNSLIKGNTIDGAEIGIFMNWQCSSNRVLNNNVFNSTRYGILIYSRIYNSLIEENILRLNDVGICLLEYDLSGNRISRNRIIDSWDTGILADSVQLSNVIIGNEITGSKVGGMELYNCINLNVVDNIISGSGSYSILLNDSDQNNFYENQMEGSGFMLYRYSGVGYGNTIPSNNTVNSMPVYYYIGNGETWSVPENTGQAVIDGCSNLKVEGISFDNVSYPIVASRANNLVISDCSFNDCGEGGIHIFQPSVTTILGNNFTRSENGVALVNGQMSQSKTVYVDFNNFTSINGVGLKVRGYKGFYTEGNLFKDCKFGCLLDNCNNYSMKKDLFIDCAGAGILMFRNSNNRITESTFYSCGVGIHEIDRCNNNVLTFNLIKGCSGPAIHLDPTSYNDKVYNNAFILNNGTGETYVDGKPQVLDENKGGRWFHPNGIGNHWYDLREPDSDSDGTVDIPYIIADDLTDDFPIAELHLTIATAPTHPGAVGFKGYVHVGWREPEETRGMPVMSYNIYRNNGTSEDEIVSTVSGMEYIFNDTDVLNDVTYTYHVQAVTVFGSGELTGPFTATPDGTPPFLEILNPLDGSIFNIDSIKVEWDARDTIIGSGLKFVTFTMDGGSPQDVTDLSSLDVMNLTGGEHEITIEAMDNVGNGITVSASFIVDLDDPFVEISSPLNGSLLNTRSFMISWNGSDPTTAVSNYSVRIDSGPWTEVGTNTSMILSDLSEGFYQLSIMAIDMAGNFNTSSISISIDFTPPTLTLRSPTNGSYHKLNRILVNWTASDDLFGIQRVSLFVDDVLNDEDLEMEEFYVEDLEDGDHNITIKAVDMAGNVKQITVLVHVDTIQPEIVEYGPVGVNVDVASNIFILFNEVLNWNSVSLMVTGVPVAFEREGLTIRYDQPSPLQYGRTYQISISGMDLAGNMVSLEWSFETDGNGSVRGQLLSPQGSPLVGVQIFLDDDEKALSNENGYFNFNITYGTYNLVIRGNNYQEKVVKAVVSAGKTTDLGQITMEPLDETPGEEKDEGGSGSWVLIVAILVVVILIVVIIVIFILSRRSRGPKESIGVYEKAEGLRGIASKRGIAIDDLEPDYKNALYQRDIGDLEDSKHSMERYVEDLERKMEE